MSIVGVLQARTSSTRLPGKVLESILGVPMIGRQLERLHRASRMDSVIVATSADPSDDALADYVAGLGVPVVRGPLDDVLARFVQAIDEHRIDTVVRLTADCPLASPQVIDAVIADFEEGGADYVSNTLTPTYPDGLDVEVVHADVLRWVDGHSDDVHEREHVTLGVYRRPDRFTVRNVSGMKDLSDLRWTVDNADDLAFVRTVYARLYHANQEFDLREVLALIERDPLLRRSSADAGRNAALEGLDTGAMNT